MKLESFVVKKTGTEGNHKFSLTRSRAAVDQAEFGGKGPYLGLTEPPKNNGVLTGKCTKSELN